MEEEGNSVSGRSATHVGVFKWARVRTIGSFLALDTLHNVLFDVNFGLFSLVDEFLDFASVRDFFVLSELQTSMSKSLEARGDI